MTRIVADWLRHPATLAVCDAIEIGGHRALFVGGCVRNALMGEPVSDLDISTDAMPERVMQLARHAGLKAIPTGIEHGTVTVVSGGIPHEVTTFRKDVETDGRRAVVAFSDRVEDDAARRDFTMNAIYADSDGQILDPLNGMPDLKARYVRFIGKAQDRIREDYLRSLRYFRFHAWYGDEVAGLDPDALSAIASNLEGLEGLSRERVGAEMLKLLAAPNPAPALAAMRSTGALAQLLPGADDRALAPLVHLEELAGSSPDSLRRLVALGGQVVETGLRLSRAQATRVGRLFDAVGDPATPAELGYRLKQPDAMDAVLLRAAMLEQPLPKNALTDVERGATALFPVQAKDLMPEIQGRVLGDTLKRLEAEWIKSGFVLTKAELLDLV